MAGNGFLSRSLASLCTAPQVGKTRIARSLIFFFLHCRTSARHCRSTTGMSEERNQISPKAKANKNKHTNQTTPTKQNTTHKNQTRQRSREICKQGETGETSASLSSPSQVLFRQVVLPHVVHVRCLQYQCRHQDTQASLEHLVDVTF